MEYFVKNINGKFTINEKVFRFIGCNMYELAFMDIGVAEKMLADAHDEGFNVVRFWAFEPLTSAKLTAICDIANKLDIRLIPVLADKWGYMQDFVVDDSWFEEGYKKSYINFAVQMVTILKDRPEILLWEIINEPEADSFEIFYNFVSDISRRVKQANSNHLLSIGTIGGLGSKYGGEFSRFSTKNFRKLYEIPELGAVSVHDYSYDATMAERMDTLYRFKGKHYAARSFEIINDYVTWIPLLVKRFWLKKFGKSITFPFTLKWLWRKFIDKNISIAEELKKPFYLGEIGYKNNLKLDRKKIIDGEIDRYFKKGIDGYLLWSFEAQGWSKDGHNYGFSKKDGFKEIIKKQNKLIGDLK